MNLLDNIDIMLSHKVTELKSIEKRIEELKIMKSRFASISPVTFKIFELVNAEGRVFTYEEIFVHLEKVDKMVKDELFNNKFNNLIEEK